MRDIRMRWIGLSLICLVGLTLCLPFLNNHLFFDDEPFFQPGYVQKFLADGVHFYPRWWVYETIALTYAGLSTKLVWLRLGNLILHLSVTMALFALVRNLLRDLDRRSDLSVSADVAALLVAALFVIHPLAIFTQGYFIQRTALCAMLFALLSLLAFWRGLSGSRLALCASCVCFALAVYAKEHVIMLPLLAFILVVLRWRSGLFFASGYRGVFAALLCQGGVALLVFLQLRGIVGTPYEVLTSEMLSGEVDIPPGQLYVLSVLNQAGLFFKYVGLWLFPDQSSISVDIRTVFPLAFAVWWLWVGVAGFVIYMACAVRLLLQGNAKGLLGFSLLAPAVVFFTEFSAVRLQESFVLYRSYLWMPFLFIALAVGLRRMRANMVFYFMLLVLPIFAVLSVMRLQTFSHPLFVWREAADVYESQSWQPGVFGGYRIYYNLGSEHRLQGFLPQALNAFNRSLELKPTFGWAWNNRGSVFLDMHNYPAAQSDYEKAVQLLPGKIPPWNGLAKALEGQGQNPQAARARQMACVLSGQAGCESIGRD